MKTAVEPESDAIAAMREAEVAQSLRVAHPAVPAQTSLPDHAVHSMQRNLGNHVRRRTLTAGALQPKLTVGAPDDIYEKEADEVAEQVMANTSFLPACSSDEGDNQPHGLAGDAANRGSAQRSMLRRIPIRTLQQNLGNRALGRLLQQTLPAPAVPELRRKCACEGDAKATAMEDGGKTDSGVYQGQPMKIGPEGPDQTPAPLNEDGLIDGQWTSEVDAYAFVNGGKTGTAIVNWAGGTGGTTPGIGSITTAAPVIETSGPGDAGATAQAWVRAGTGTATVSRSYIGTLVGANGANYFITGSAATRIDRHEENHIAHSRTRHDASITPLETRIATHTGLANALNQGADAAAAKTALETLLDWNNSITSFRNGDNADNLPGGAVDTADAASADFYRDYGARTVGGVNFAHYVDTPPGPPPAPPPAPPPGP